MVASLSNRVVARSAAAMLLLGGSVGLATLPLVGNGTPLRGAAVTDIASVGLGIFAWFAPWGRWPRRAPLWLAPLAFVLMASGPALNKEVPFTYAMYFLIAFVWFGIGFPRGTSVLMAVPAAAAFVGGILAGHGTSEEVLTVLQVIPISAALGEVLGWLSTKLRVAEALDNIHVRNMTKLLAATELLARQTEWEGAPDLISQLAAELVGGDGAVLFVSQPYGNLAVEGSWSWPDADALGRFDPTSWPEMVAALQTRRPLLIEPGDTGPFSHWASALIKPLAGTAGVVGVIVVGFDEPARPLDGFTENVSKTFATQAGLAVQRLQVKEWLVDATMRDELTGVGNRRAAEEALERMTPGDACVLLDLDNFKQVNDTLGHQAGDDTLRSFATHLLGSLRDGDIVARYGGDEFLLVLRKPGGRAKPAMERTESRWRKVSPAVTFSAGVAEHRPGSTHADTLAGADEALYDAKRAGRGRVMSWEPPQTRLSA